MDKDLLTVEEAAKLLRIGRTKAYAMAQEWRATDGRSGLPVIDFGHILRVPVHRLEALLGGPIHTAVTETQPAPELEPAPPSPAAAAASSDPKPSRRRRPRTNPDQLALFASDTNTP